MTIDERIIENVVSREIIEVGAQDLQSVTEIGASTTIGINISKNTVSLSTSGNIESAKSITALNFYGDGSNLTGIAFDTPTLQEVTSEGSQTSNALTLTESTTSIYASGDIVTTGDLEANNIYGNFIGEGSEITNINYTETQTLQDVTTLGSTTSDILTLTNAGTAIAATADIITNGSYYGDGSNLTGIVLATPTLQEVTSEGAETSNALTLTESTTSIYASGDIVTIGEIEALSYHGDGSNLTGLLEAQNLEEVMTEGNVSSAILTLTNETTSIAASGDIIIDGIYHGNGSGLTNINYTETQDLQNITTLGATTSDIVTFTSATTSIEASGDIVTDGNIYANDIFISGNLYRENVTYGNLGIAYNTNTQAASAKNVYLTVTVATSGINLRNATYANSFITVGKTGVYLAQLNMSSRGTINDVMHCGISINNAQPLGYMEFRVKYVGQTSTQDGGAGGIISLNEGDTISIQFKNETSTDAITIKHANLYFHRISTE